MKINLGLPINLDTLNFDNSICKITINYLQITSQYLFFESDTVLYCYFVFPNQMYFLEHQSIIYANLEVDSDSFKV